MNNLPKCGLCGERLADASAIGWYCPTRGCDGDWEEKLDITFIMPKSNEQLEEENKKLREAINKIKALHSDNNNDEIDRDIGVSEILDTLEDK